MLSGSHHTPSIYATRTRFNQAILNPISRMEFQRSRNTLGETPNTLQRKKTIQLRRFSWLIRRCVFPTDKSLQRRFWPSGLSSSSNVKSSCHRSVRTAIGINLWKLRLGLSNSLLTIMFELPDKRVVSRIINSARQALLESFVPYNLGFNHITRQEIIDLNTTTIARELMCDGGEDTVVVVVDGTYIYIQVRKYPYALFSNIFLSFQKSRNTSFQRKLFSLHKKRSLLKPMMIVSTTGYIVACIEPFFSDFSNNDASIMKDILLQNTEDILNWIDGVYYVFLILT